MRDIVARCVVAMGVGLALIVAQGCKKQAVQAPAGPMVVSAPRVQLDFPVGPLPVEDIDSGAMPRVERVELRREQVQPVPVQRADAQVAAVAAAAQRLQDERLLQEQEAASQRQQEELDREIEQDMRTQEEMEAEPRIQDIPELPPEPVPVEPTQPQ